MEFSFFYGYDANWGRSKDSLLEQLFEKLLIKLSDKSFFYFKIVPFADKDSIFSLNFIAWVSY
jgi:hypothetical protein